jgi:hypothetical protein
MTTSIARTPCTRHQRIAETRAGDAAFGLGRGISRDQGPPVMLRGRTPTPPREVMQVLAGVHTSAGSPGAARHAAVIAGIKLIHSVIFLVNSASILHIFWAGVCGRPSRWTRFALAAALAESAVFVVNRGRCPLTSLVEDLGAESGRVSDIFLPRWFADRIPHLCAPPLVVGLLALLFNAWRRRGSEGHGACCQSTPVTRGEFVRD